MRALATFFCLTLGVLILSFLPKKKSEEIKSTPNKQVIEWTISQHKSLLKELYAFQKTIELNQQNEEKVQTAFHELKNTFKKIEFLYYYLDPQNFSMSINGAPLPKLMKKVPDMTIVEPKGFQRLEELIYEDAFTSEVKEMLKQLERDLLNTEQLMNYRVMTDAIIFEAIRYGIIRINTMGVTGFDSPVNSDASLIESAQFFNGIIDVLSFYQTYIPVELNANITTLSKKAIAMLTASSFEEFNRFEFIKEVLDPLWKETLKLQQRLQIELPHQRFSKLKRPVNYLAESLYAEDFLNVDYFSEYSGDKQHERTQLGEQLFFEKQLSEKGLHSCATCHHPSKAFTDGLPLSRNLVDGGPGKRNAPTLINVVYSEKFFHDMRVDRLAFQMDHVVLNPIEFNVRYDTIINRLKRDERFVKAFKESYGAEGISKNTITNAMSAYVASLTAFNSIFDKTIRNEQADINSDVIDGFNLFMGKAACATCHFPPTFSGLLPPEYAENESEVLGVPATSEEPYEIDEDLGRYMNHILMEQAPFYKNSFKTPTVRNINQSAPYMHNGVYNTLEEVIEFYDAGGGIGLGLDVPHQTMPGDSLHLTDQEKKALIEFMRSLEDNPFNK
jgi:cytochrome c peroxidase